MVCTTPILFLTRRFADFAKALPYSAQLVAVEMGGEPLAEFEHPKRAVYLLGSEDNGIPEYVLRMCHKRVTLPCVRCALDSHYYRGYNPVLRTDLLLPYQLLHP